MYQFTFEPLLYTSVFGCVCGFGFEQKFWQINGFGEKKTRIGGFAYPYSPPSYINLETFQFTVRCSVKHFMAYYFAILPLPMYM